jgi:hypothetical protein
MELRGGNYPIKNSEYVAGLVLLAGVTDVPRLNELDAIAVETRENLESIQADRAAKLEAP